MISAKSRFFRAMKNCPRVSFHEENSEPSANFATYESESEKFFISESGIFDDKGILDIHFSDIEAASCMIDDIVLLDGIQLKMKNGEFIKLNLSGHDGRQYDAHLFVRFLIRTLEDREKQQNP